MKSDYQGIAIAFADREDGTPTGLLFVEALGVHVTRFVIQDEDGKILTFFDLDADLLEALLGVASREGASTPWKK